VNLGADVVIFGAKISKSCLLKGRREEWSGDLWEILASALAKKNPPTRALKASTNHYDPSPPRLNIQTYSEYSFEPIYRLDRVE